MFELIQAGGWVMWPIIVCSVAALAIIAERFWSLQKKYIAPAGLLDEAQGLIKQTQIDPARLEALRSGSPLGEVLAAGLSNKQHSREVVMEAVEDAGRHAVPELERYLNTLGTIAAVSPFLGLLGTVLGMIDMFAGISQRGLGDPTIVAGGIAQALITTAAGLAVAIPALMFYRYFRGRVNMLLIDMERQAIRLVEVLHASRTGL